jgi:starvation-inducible outer membrane lipoprotein
MVESMAKSLPIKIPQGNEKSQSSISSSRSPRTLVFSQSQHNASPQNSLEAISLPLDPIAHPSSPPEKMGKISMI